jgi:hypothetical protein
MVNHLLKPIGSCERGVHGVGRVAPGDIWVASEYVVINLDLGVLAAVKEPADPFVGFDHVSDQLPNTPIGTWGATR